MDEIKDFNRKNSELLTLMKERMNEPENERYIIPDGVMKPDLFLSNTIRLAWMLKEPYDSENGTGGGWDYFKMFPEGVDLYQHTFKEAHKSTWHPMIYISYSIHNGFPKWEEMNYIRDKHEMCDIVRQVAFINAQKLPSKGITRTDFGDLRESISKYSDLLRRQIELLNPNVFIFGRTIDLYKDILRLSLQEFENSGSCQYLIKEDKLYISAYHPSQRTVTREKYVNDIIGLVKKWANDKV